ncbi:NNP family nitrate/nitrite transporter-like MFS transporter [Nocardiopsis mwathae]|uniref:NNP family nitrate/nitrite transporter-like MFS transporter n=1 Tax=Nocardiopsis mwathae TaxID=1472723 RepID=A0A7W9YGR2_9ACTN|nr:MFS transporter [Nocardiopsis mwathae]MBB6171850.1 NNP family nitrate/nitrite transporter-like MFS transporter [Nocardiopsis mwathae]
MRAESGGAETTGGGRGVNLALATAAFAVTFAAWNLIGPLSATYTERLGLTPSQVAVLVAFPVLVGALGRIPVGALTDRYGGRVMFTAVCFASIIPVLLVGLSGHSYPMLLLWGFFLGIAGTSFAVGIPFVSAWYPPRRKGFATGVFGAGMGGTALAAFFAPRSVELLGLWGTHVAMAAVLAVMGTVMLLFSRNAPQWRPGTEPVLPRMAAAARMAATWKMAGLYALVFGGFVAFSTYLPTVLTTAYDFLQTEAGLRTAGFSVAAVLARPVGGILSDRIGPVRVCLASFFATAVLAVALAFHPPAEVPAGTAFVLMAVALGLGTGSVFALVAKVVEPSRVGTVTGLVGAAGGLGGYFPPMVMGVVFQATGAYTIGFALLGATALAVAVYTAVAFREVDRATRRPAPGGV